MFVLSRGTQAHAVGLQQVASGMISALVGLVSPGGNEQDEEAEEEVETQGLLGYFKW